MQPPASAPGASPWRMSVAPMMDWTDRHCRYLHRLLTRHTLLYTEMVNVGGILFGGTERHLRYNAEEHPVALQLGGNEPGKLAQAARLGEQWGYDEINLNCGCPSDRVQRGAFGASLMKSAHVGGRLREGHGGRGGGTRDGQAPHRARQG
jgi:tRNA-dihydrouridine synthase A